MRKAMKEIWESAKEGWKESKWFRFLMIWAIIHLITAYLLYYGFFGAPFGFQFAWNVLSAREFTIYSSICATFITGILFGTAMFFREVRKRR